MTLIIDGHNLIPHMPGVALSDPDDEEKLIKIIQDFCRVKGVSAEIYFDGAPTGYAGKKQFGRVCAHFVRKGITADEAIMVRLKQLGKRAKNMRVVSSDRQVQQAARASHASVISSSSFASDWQKNMEEIPELDPRSRLLSEAEVDDWERLFQRGHPPSQENK
ncbi:MAG: NYN domain-containing protein [Chloroflexota bacterium]|nr:NYN domain-containing protein [Chloroflexota bacterium]